MAFAYTGENQSMDHISPQPLGPFLIFHDQNDGFDCGVAYDAGVYRTVGCSFELGMLTDGSQPSTRAALLDSIMWFLGYAPGIEDFSTASDTRRTFILVQPNPCRQTARITVNRSNATPCVIAIQDITGRTVVEYDISALYSSPVAEIIWNGTDRNGKRVPDGVYFVQMKTTGSTLTEKIILLH
jgi:hypothetical protein